MSFCIGGDEMNLDKKIKKLKLQPIENHPDYEMFSDAIRNDYQYFKRSKRDWQFFLYSTGYLESKSYREIVQKHNEQSFIMSKWDIKRWWFKFDMFLYRTFGIDIGGK